LRVPTTYKLGKKTFKPKSGRRTKKRGGNNGKGGGGRGILRFSGRDEVRGGDTSQPQSHNTGGQKKKKIWPLIIGKVAKTNGTIKSALAVGDYKKEFGEGKNGISEEGSWWHLTRKEKKDTRKRN